MAGKATERILTVRIQLLLEDKQGAQAALAKIRSDVDAVGATSVKSGQVAAQGLGQVGNAAAQAKPQVDALNESLEKAVQSAKVAPTVPAQAAAGQQPTNAIQRMEALKIEARAALEAATAHKQVAVATVQDAQATNQDTQATQTSVRVEEELNATLAQRINLFNQMRQQGVSPKDAAAFLGVPAETLQRAVPSAQPVESAVQRLARQKQEAIEGLRAAGVGAGRTTGAGFVPPVGDVLRAGEGMSVKEAEKFNQLVAQGVPGIEAAQQAMSGLGQQTKGVTGGLRGMHGAYIAIFSIMRLGMELQTAGAALQTDINTKQATYLKAAGQFSPLARAWNEQLANVERANARIGEIITEQQLPAMKEQAAQAQLLSDIYARHPALSRAQVGAGQVLTGAGGILQYGSQMAMLALSLQQLSHSGMLGAGGIFGAGGLRGLAGTTGLATAGAGAGVMGTGALGLLTNPVTAGIATGAIANQFMPTIRTGARGVDIGMGATIGAELGKFDFDKAAALVQRWALAHLAGQNAADKYFTAISEGKGWIDAATAAEMRLAMARKEGVTEIDTLKMKATWSQGVTAYVDYQKQLTDLDQQTSDQRTKINKDYSDKESEIRSKYGQDWLAITSDSIKQQKREDSDLAFNRAKQARDFEKSETETTQDYYADRLKAAQDFGEEEVNNERKHQREMANMEQDHQLRMEEFVATGDALGAFREMRNYEVKRQQAEATYADETETRSKDLGKRLAEMDADFAKERERRKEHFDQQIKDQDEVLARQRAQDAQDLKDRLKALDDERTASLTKLEENKNAALGELDDTATKEREKITGTFNDLMNDLGIQTDAAKKKYQAYFDMMGLQFENYIGRVGAAISGLPGFEQMAGLAPAQRLADISKKKEQDMTTPEGLPIQQKTSPRGYPGVGVGRQPVQPQAVGGTQPQSVRTETNFNVNITVDGSLSDSEMATIQSQTRQTIDDVIRTHRTGPY